MEIALLHDSYNKKHLAKVKAEMGVLGTPTIKAIWMPEYEIYAALEGCHRLRACKELGIVPQINEVALDDVGSVLVRDYTDMDNDGTVADCIADCHRRTIITFEEEEKR